MQTLSDLRKLQVKPLSDEELVRLQKMLFAVYRDVRDCAARHGLTCLLAGGSLLGAVRHKGFIPWDDDLDVMMLRADYERLPVALEADYPGRYSCVAPGTGNGCRYPFLKVRRNGTKLVSVFDCPCENPGVAIDVFPFDAVPSGFFRRLVRGTLVNGLIFIGGSVRRFRRPSPGERLMARGWKGAFLHAVRRCVGAFFCFRSFEAWYLLAHRLVSRPCKADARFVTNAFGRGRYFRERVLKDILLPPSQVVFCGECCPAPQDPERWLTNLYGSNFLTPPPVERREQHFVVKMSLS